MHQEKPGEVRPVVALLTGGGDRPYALGLSESLLQRGIALDFIGSDEVDAPFLHSPPLARFLNLRGDQSPQAPVATKMLRLARYYARLVAYAATAQPRIFHLLWNNKFEYFDRTVLMAYYRLLGRRVMLTAHNVNIRRRDGNDSALNRWTLRYQYRHADRIFVHTGLMKQELVAQFGVAPERCVVIPFGLNSTVPDTALTPAQARAKLGLGAAEKVLLFFGNIAPYKGLNFLVDALALARQSGAQYRLVIAGRPKGAEGYWAGIRGQIEAAGLRDQITERIEFVPDEETEIYFKAADVLVLPYLQIFQSGVLFLGYNFGLPVIASDVGALREEVIEGSTGFMCQPSDPADLARALERYFDSPLYRNLDQERGRIRAHAANKYSWATVADITAKAYAELGLR
ncbi:MAG TPA: glycosyltransferase family 4 protein [Candidatus Didemnitutus sp.]|nr:glycosyltransferase family 4 protein [Candidatus Didemnitutus sp.]